MISKTIVQHPSPNGNGKRKIEQEEWWEADDGINRSQLLEDFEGENFEQEERWEKKQEKRRRDESIQERSRGSGYFFWAHNKVLADPHLSHSEVRVYMGLATFGGCRVISPGMERIAQRSGVSPRTVWQAIKKLEDLELVHVRRNAKGRVSHVYRLLRSHNGCRHCVQAEINRRAIQEMEKRERNLEYDEFDLERDLK